MTVKWKECDGSHGGRFHWARPRSGMHHFDHVAIHNKKESEQQNIFVHQETEGIEFAFGEPRATVLTSRIPVVPTTVLTYVTFLVHSLYLLKFLPPFSSSTEEPIFLPS